MVLLKTWLRMKTERYFKKKIIKKILEIFIFPIFVVVGLTFIMGFYYERNVYVKLNDITVELGDKLPEEITRYINLLTNDSNLALETSVPLDEAGNTKMIGTFNYYLVYNDSNYMYSRLTNNKSTITVIDTIKPTIKVKDNVEVDYNSEFSIDDIAECIDLSGCKMTIKEEVDTTKSGDYEVNITAIDGGNNVSYAKTTFKVKEKPKPIYNYVSNYTLNIEQNNIKNASLSEEEKESLRYEIANFAKQFVGNPYVYGGTSLTNGTDCSGFTMSVYANFGYSLPRSSGDYYYVGKAVSEAELLPGDIVVYPGHVGIYFGNGMMVHASTPQSGIVYAPMYPGYRSYRRIIY